MDSQGAQLGVMKTRDALNMALEKGMDLVEIAPTAQIPVCRIMDYGKYKFEKAKKEKEAKKKQVVVETKEIQLTCRIGIHDFNTRLSQTRKFIEAGNKVKICLEFAKGREMAHMEFGYQMLEKFEQACLDFSIVEKKPVREGRKITMFIAPKKVKPEPASGISNKNTDKQDFKGDDNQNDSDINDDNENNGSVEITNTNEPETEDAEEKVLK
ncbi:MAG: translation initiation factor IF-3 [Oscillospiraceae bacterium]|nr:translation initiation factor IF-3 [Oscillospiraceae bacterium]